MTIRERVEELRDSILCLTDRHCDIINACPCCQIRDALGCLLEEIPSSLPEPPQRNPISAEMVRDAGEDVTKFMLNGNSNLDADMLMAIALNSRLAISPKGTQEATRAQILDQAYNLLWKLWNENDKDCYLGDALYAIRQIPNEASHPSPPGGTQKDPR